MTTDTGNERRSGAETRAEILRVALRLFTEKGFEGTTTRDISSALGITKSSLYYHFQNKEAIVASLMAERMSELDNLVEWISAQPPAPDLLRRAAVRWIDSTTPERIQAMLLAHANQPVMKRLAGSGNDVRTGFDAVIALFAGEDASEADRLYVRMAFDTVGAALLTARNTRATPEEVIATARRATIALTT
ncbi:TetR/AcrR family transcriptional regulator [Umezawaea tangerina]|uniref:TetR family transcriptional regulator n=1 Tax=Umezawaea tangerina TaxID=84725 RepID=A0A2T0T4F4_9PSEU|nr:TetR/AcrR family transcriptional regulator [Umezawaea tangerina]PRY40556.1 TetR family transcriptional regulator [Umezawaea tangerina]